MSGSRRSEAPSTSMATRCRPATVSRHRTRRPSRFARVAARRSSWFSTWRRASELRQAGAAGLPAALVDRAPLDRREARVADELDYGRLAHFIVRTRGRDDVLLDHDRAEVVGAERRRDAADF